MVLAFEARVVGGEPRLNPEALEIATFAPEAIPWPGIAFKTSYWAIRDWLHRRRPGHPPGRSPLGRVGLPAAWPEPEPEPGRARVVRVVRVRTKRRPDRWAHAGRRRCGSLRRQMVRPGYQSMFDRGVGCGRRSGVRRLVRPSDHQRAVEMPLSRG